MDTSNNSIHTSNNSIHLTYKNVAIQTGRRNITMQRTMTIGTVIASQFILLLQHHEEIKAIEYVTNAPPPDLEAAKRERLLTIPRLQKSAPPTHLLCSHSGDFLRCRLIDANEECS